MNCPLLPGLTAAIAWSAVSAGSAAVVYRGRWVGNDHGAQCQGNVHVAIVCYVAHAAPIRPSLVHFKLIYYLHGSHLCAARASQALHLLLQPKRIAVVTDQFCDRLT